jgi:hypothetical protein
MNFFTYYFPLIFISGIISVAFLLSRMGWHSLASKYSYKAIFIGERVRINSIKVNWISYNGTVIIEYDTKGLYLKQIPLFRLFHEPIFIPSREIREIRDKKILLSNYKILIVGEPLVAKISFEKSDFLKIEGQLKAYVSI